MGETHGWIDKVSHWKAVGQLQSNGSMTKADVIDNHGTTRTRDVTFASEKDFLAWCKQRA